MRSFSDVSKTVRETAIVISISLTFIFLLVAAVIIPSVLNRGNLLNPLFLIGFVLFGGLGFLALEIVGVLSFLGEGVKYGVAGFILLLLAGAITGGNTAVVSFRHHQRGHSLLPEEPLRGLRDCENRDP